MASKKNVIGKAELIEILRENTGLSKRDLEISINAFVDVVKQEVLENGSDLRVKNLGTFKQKVTAARTGRNPKTGEELQIKAITTVAFSAASNLKVREGEAIEEDK